MTQTPGAVEYSRECHLHESQWRELFQCLLHFQGSTADALHEGVTNWLFQKRDELEKSADEWISRNPPLFPLEVYDKRLERHFAKWEQFTGELYSARQTHNQVTLEWIEEVWKTLKVYELETDIDAVK